jgi:hypothetical protein
MAPIWSPRDQKSEIWWLSFGISFKPLGPLKSGEDVIIWIDGLLTQTASRLPPILNMIGIKITDSGSSWIMQGAELGSDTLKPQAAPRYEVPSRVGDGEEHNILICAGGGLSIWEDGVLINTFDGQYMSPQDILPGFRFSGTVIESKTLSVDIYHATVITPSVEHTVGLDNIFYSPPPEPYQPGFFLQPSPFSYEYNTDTARLLVTNPLNSGYVFFSFICYLSLTL